MRHSQLRGGDAAISWRVQYCSSRSQRALDTMPRCAATADVRRQDIAPVDCRWRSACRSTSDCVTIRARLSSAQIPIRTQPRGWEGGCRVLLLQHVVGKQ